MRLVAACRLATAFTRTSGGWHGLARQAVARGVAVSFRCGHNGHGLEYKTVPPFVFRRSLPFAEHARNEGLVSGHTSAYASVMGTSRARKPRKSATKSNSPPIEGAVLAGMRSRERATGKPASQLIDQPNRELGDWRDQALARMRALILEADPEMIEERKWRKPSNAMAGVPVWSHHGIICTGETYTKVVKLTFAKGASIPDPSRLFNSGLEGNTRRAIDIREGEVLDAVAFKALIQAAVAKNLRLSAPKSKSSRPPHRR
jgi:hypothetical protein